MESFLGYDIDSEHMLRIGVILLQLVITLTFAVFSLVIVLRILLQYHKFRRAKFISVWRPILMGCIMEFPNSLPKLDHKYINEFIGEWNSLYENLAGNSHQNLINIAAELGIHHTAIKMLISNHIKIRLTGIITLGNMRFKPAWPLLESIAKSNQVFLSIAALRALILIDSKKALEELLPMLISRVDWPVNMVVKVLKDCNNEEVCELITKTCKDTNDEQLANLIQYINALKCTCASRVFHNILSQDKDDHLKSLCLKKLNDPTAIDLVRKHVTSERWHVRMNAAKALGNIGAQQDVKLLSHLLNDNKWWVRYRAAQSLLKMPFLSIEQLLEIQRNQQSKQAKNIISQVIAEQELI
jgi:hypothetical protein